MSLISDERRPLCSGAVLFIRYVVIHKSPPIQNHESVPIYQHNYMSPVVTQAGGKFYLFYLA